MTFCKFHPLVKAKYSCSECDIICCDECSDETRALHNPELGCSCFICGTTLEQISKESNVIPFWRVLNDIYRYPTSLSALLVIFVNALLVSFLSSIWLVWLFTSIAVIHYCFACLRHTALGNMNAPDFSESFEGSISPIFYVILVTIIASIAAGALTSMFGLGFGVLAWIAIIIALPAAVLLIAIEEKLLPALNPSRLMAIVSATGTSYYVMILFILLMSSSVGVLSSVFASESMSAIGLFIQALISNYYFIVIFHIMGYLVHQNGHRLGFANKNNATLETTRSNEKRLNAQIDVLIKSGAYEDALKLCSKQVKANNANLWQWNRCYKLMLTSESDKQIDAFTIAYFKKLDELDRIDTIAEAYVRIKKRLPSLVLDNAKLQIKIADELIQIGQYKYVILLLRQIHTVTQNKKLLAKSFNLLSQAYEKIPGGEKNAIVFKQQHERLAASL